MFLQRLAARFVAEFKSLDIDRRHLYREARPDSVLYRGQLDGHLSGAEGGAQHDDIGGERAPRFGSDLTGVESDYLAGNHAQLGYNFVQVGIGAFPQRDSVGDYGLGIEQDGAGLSHIGAVTQCLCRLQPDENIPFADGDERTVYLAANADDADHRSAPHRHPQNLRTAHIQAIAHGGIAQQLRN